MAFVSVIFLEIFQNSLKSKCYPLPQKMLKYCKYLFRFQMLVSMHQRMFPALVVDVDAELAKYQKYAERIRPFVKETVSYLDKCLQDGKKILVEGANAAMLDIDFGKLC